MHAKDEIIHLQAGKCHASMIILTASEELHSTMSSSSPGYPNCMYHTHALTPSPGHPHALNHTSIPTASPLSSSQPHTHVLILTRHMQPHTHVPHPHQVIFTASHSHTYTITLTHTPSLPHQVILAATGTGWGEAHVDGAIATQPALLLLAHHHSASGRRLLHHHNRVNRSHDHNTVWSCDQALVYILAIVGQ